MAGLAESFLDSSVKVWRILSTSTGILGVFFHHTSRDFRYKQFYLHGTLFPGSCVCLQLLQVTPLAEFVWEGEFATPTKFLKHSKINRP